MHTLTATDTLTSITVETELATATETATEFEKEVITKTEHEVVTVHEPVYAFSSRSLLFNRSHTLQTTYVSIWLTTEVNNETETLVKTNSETVIGQLPPSLSLKKTHPRIDTLTLVKTVDATNTVTETAVEKETIVVPTTIVSKYTTTEVIDETLTKERVVETTIHQVRTLEHTRRTAIPDRSNRPTPLKSPTRSLQPPPSLRPLRRLDW